MVFSDITDIISDGIQFKCDRGGVIPSHDVCIYQLDVDGIVTGCRDFSHLHDCGKKTNLYTSKYTLKKSYKRPPHIFSSNSESKILSIKIHDQINKPMSYSGSVSFCIPKCAIYLTQTKHE